TTSEVRQLGARGAPVGGVEAADQAVLSREFKQPTGGLCLPVHLGGPTAERGQGAREQRLRHRRRAVGEELEVLRISGHRVTGHVQYTEILVKFRAVQTNVTKLVEDNTK